MAATPAHLPTFTLPQAVTPTDRSNLLPPSAQTVYDLLALHGPQTHKDLVATAGLPARTIRWAVHRLREEGLVQGRLNVRDPRQTFFFVNP
ncbi:MAG TPA: hypothetical protein VNZ52_08460 [Candidatus Thermoplasmatota archaeon]|nr:hypothetical protein [Candidatus Thermoplasmatota archaeon]